MNTLSPQSDVKVVTKRKCKMLIIAQCPRCSSRWKLDAAAADKRIKCKKCYTLFKLPKLSDLSIATNVLKNAKGTIYVDQKGKTYG